MILTPMCYCLYSCMCLCVSVYSVQESTAMLACWVRHFHRGSPQLSLFAAVENHHLDDAISLWWSMIVMVFCLDNVESDNVCGLSYANSIHSFFTLEPRLFALSKKMNMTKTIISTPRLFTLVKKMMKSRWSWWSWWSSPAPDYLHSSLPAGNLRICHGQRFAVRTCHK